MTQASSIFTSTKRPDKICPACDRGIWFVKMQSSRWAAVDAMIYKAQKDDPKVHHVTEDGRVEIGVVYGQEYLLDHHATCTDPKRFKKPKEKKDE